MKKFLIVSSGLLIIALLAVIATFCYLSFQIKSNQPPLNTTEPTTVPEGIPLRELPLTEGQQNVLEKTGIDPDTFVITPAMQTCAAKKLGEARFNEIIAGATPTVLETVGLTSCAGSS